MPDVRRPRKRGQGTRTPSDHAATTPPEQEVRPTAAPAVPALNWQDPFAVRAWVKDTEAHVEDLATVAEDQTNPPGDRMYGRAGAREKIDEATDSLRLQLARAKRGLAVDEARVKVTVFPETRPDGRRHISLMNYDGSECPDMLVLPEHLDGDRVLVVVLSNPDEEPVTVLVPSEVPDGTRVRVYRQHLIRAREP